MTATRIIAYTPNGASLGPIPSPLSVQAGYPLNDVGALSMNYPLAGPRTDVLGQPVELAVEVSWDKGVTWQEPASSRFLYLRDGRDPIKGDAYSIEAPGYVLRLQKALVGFSGLDADGKRTFTDATPGMILRTLFNEAQARGALTGMSMNGSATQDGAGTPWPTTVTMSYDPGANLLSVLQGLADDGLVDYRTQGRSIQVYVQEHASGMAADRTTGAAPVSLRFGRDLTEAPFRRTWEALADTALIQGDNGATLERTNAGAAAPWGRQETYVTASGVEDAGTLQVVGDAALTFTSEARTEHTFGLDFTAATHLPFRDYAPGEWVYKATDGALPPERMRVRQITLTRDEQGFSSGNVVLNDRFLEADVAQARRIAKITGGATQSGTGGSPTPAGTGPDILAPAQVTGLDVTSTAYVGQDGRTLAQVTVNWTDTTTNADGSPMGDLAGYEVWRRHVGVTDWHMFRTTEVSSLTDSPYAPGEDWEFRVRAVDSVYNRGAYSATDAVTTATDNVPPPVPATPTLATRMGIVQANWNGLTATGAAMPSDFAYVEAHISSVDGFVPVLGGNTTRGGELTGPGQVIFATPAYNANRYVRLIAVDTSGNTSLSAQAAILVKPLVQADIIGQIVDGAALIDASIDAASKIKVASIDTAQLRVGQLQLIADSNFADSSIRAYRATRGTGTGTAQVLTFANDASSPIAGAYYANLQRITNAALNVFLEPVTNANYSMDLVAGQVYRFAYKVWADAAAIAHGGRIRGTFYWKKNDGSISYAAMETNAGVTPASAAFNLSNLTPNTWTDWEMEWTAPADIVSGYPALQWIAGAGAVGGNVRLFAPDFRQKIGGVLIQDGAVTAPKIQSLAVETDKLAANAVTTPKLDVGAVTAEKMTVGARGISVLKNSGMEEVDQATPTRPASWKHIYSNGTVSTMALETAVPLSGKQSMKLTIPTTNTGDTIGQDGVDHYPVSGGQKWYVRATFKASSTRAAGKRVILRMHTSQNGASPYNVFDSNVTWHTFFSSVTVVANTTYTIEGLVTVPTGHTLANASISWDSDFSAASAVTLTVDDIEMFPATTDSQITEVSSGKIRTGILQATERIVAGSLTGARSELNGLGFQAFDAAGVKTFEVLGSTGAAYFAGSVVTKATGANGRVELSALNNPYQTGQLWGTLAFYSNNAAWDPALLWAVYGTDSGPLNWGTLSIRGPKLGTRQPAAIDLRSEEQTNQTSISLNANQINMTANSYLWGDPNSGTVIHKLLYSGANASQGFRFASSGDKRIVLDFGTAGQNEIKSYDAGTFLRLKFLADDFYFGVVGGDNLTIRKDNTSARVQVANADQPVAITLTTAHVRASTYAASTYIPMAASAFNVNSDERHKTNLKKVTGARAQVKALTVYDYDTPNGSPERATEMEGLTKAARGRKKFRERGVMAQSVQQVIPHAVSDQDDDDSGLTVSLYPLLSTALAAIQEQDDALVAAVSMIQELRSELDTLKRQKPAK